MRNMKKWLLTAFFFLSITTVFAQGKISGIIQDNSGALPGANVVIEGTSTGTSTGFDGSFALNATTSKGNVVVSFLGFTSKTIPFTIVNGQADLGTIVLSDEGNVLGEVVITSTVIDVAKDRKTPVAVSTIKASEIKEKLGNQEFPEMLANTPSVYATKSGGGFGDSRINIRGFAQENIAVMVNGMPVNDMENSAVFWSNWAGLSDVTSAMQVQRGLGSSKLAISSVGGTINIITRTSDMKEGGSFTATLGNNDYIKTVGSYSTGKMKNGFSASILLGNAQGNMYADGTKFSAQNYFIGLGYEINDNHDLQFTFTGAPQWHNQRSAAPTIAQFLKYGGGSEPNRKYNSDWGVLNGEQYSFRTNFYHKPIASLNYNWKINDKTKLSTVFYGSWGRGGGSNGAGAIRGNRFFADNLRLTDGTINMNLIQAWNSGNPTSLGTRAQIGGAYQNSSSTSNNLTNGISKISSVNSHDWYGGIVNLNRRLGENFTLDFGLDARTYRGYHFQVLNDLIGATNYSDNFDVNNVNGAGVQQPRILTETYSTKPNFNPFTDVKGQEKINYNNDGLVRWYGAFTQLEYTKGNLSAFLQGAISQQGFKRVDYFKYKSSDPLSSTDFENILGGNVKGGANYNINEKHNVFLNAGYYSKQPFFNAVYPNNASLVNGNLVNEKILGFEAGYGFRSSIFNANLNLYHTTWKDRYQRSTDNAADNPGGYYDFAGITEIHSGVELDVNARIMDKLRLNGMFSYGNWVYDGNSTSNRYDANNAPIAGGTSQTLYLDKVKVGNVAQMTASVGADYEVVKNLRFDANYRFSDKLYAFISPGSFSVEGHKGSLELPSYGLLDTGVSFKIHRTKDSKDSFNFRLNINNLLDEVYIAESRSNIFADDKVSTAANAPTYQQAGRTYDGVADANTVYFGYGRTWNLTFRYEF